MSHIVEAKTTIKNPDLALLRQAVEIVAEQHTGTLQSFYLDFYGRQHEVPTKLVLYIPDGKERAYDRVLPRGIGLVVDDTTGALTFVGDPWAVEEFFTEVQQQIVQTYTGLAMMQVMRTMGFQPSAQQEEEQGRMVITGVSYA